MKQLNGKTACRTGFHQKRVEPHRRRNQISTDSLPLGHHAIEKIAINMAYYLPEKHLREVAIPSASSTALLFIDVQNYNCSRDGAIYMSMSDTEKEVWWCIGLIDFYFGTKNFHRHRRRFW